jgi:hypothetical protein
VPCPDGFIYSLTTKIHAPLDFYWSSVDFPHASCNSKDPAKRPFIQCAKISFLPRVPMDVPRTDRQSIC